MENLKSKVRIKLTEKLEDLFSPRSKKALDVSRKEDRSFVTELDIYISDLFKEELKNDPKYRDHHFFSEEDHTTLAFPTCVLDPIDGTRELVRGSPECAVSMALMNSSNIEDPKNAAWIFSPFSGFSLDTDEAFCPTEKYKNSLLLGMVSRSEFDKGFFDPFLNINAKIVITPRGSIAFKLGLLAAGACDFVLSLSPKNIWDIAAGTILCSKRGIYLYQNGARITELSSVNIKGPLLWATESVASELFVHFKNEKNS